MGTSTKRPKPKPGQSAGKNANGKQSANQQGGTTQPAAKAAAEAAESSAKTASGALPSAPKTPTAKTPTTPASSTGATVVNKGSSAPAKSQPARPQVNKREQKQQARREEISRKIEERRQQREREQRKRTMKKLTYIGVPAAVVVVLIGIFLYNLLFGPQVAAYLKGDPIDGIQCQPSEQVASHYHAHLQIYINGQQVPVATDVGRQDSSCIYWLHTHAGIPGDDGVIHVESPDNRTFTLHQFFDIWGQQLSATNLLGHKVDASHKLTVYVYAPTNQPTDNQTPFTVTPPNDLKPYTGDPAQIQLKPHELIVLEYGTPTVPPSAFSFPAGE